MSARVRLPNPLAALDDRALLARFAEQHEQPAFEQLVKRHGGLVFGVCRRAVRDLHLAEDAFQAVFLVLARNPDGAAKAASVGGWLFGVARRVGLAARRREVRREKREAHSSQQGTYAPRSPDFDELLSVLDEELAAMPDELRAPLVACFLEERTQDEAARELGWSLSTLRRRLDRGKELLRSRLARRGVTLAAGLLAGSLSSARAAVPPIANVPSPLSAALASEVLKRGLLAKLAAVAVMVVAGVALGLATASPDEPRTPPTFPLKSQPEPGPELILAPVPRAAASNQWVNVSGRVVFPKDRVIPPPRLVPANLIKDVEVWRGFEPLVHEDMVVNTDNRGIKNVVVFLRPDSEDRKAEFPADKLPLDFVNGKPTDHVVQVERGQFAPRVLAVRAGDRVVFGNPLRVATNVHYTANQIDTDDSRSFNMILVTGMTHTTKPLPALRVPDSYKSNIHPWLTGYVWAFDHPYFAVTDENGNFEIKNAPAGKWRLVAWHEAVGYLGGASGRLGEQVTVPEAAKLELKPLVFESKNWPTEK